MSADTHPLLRLRRRRLSSTPNCPFERRWPTSVLRSRSLLRVRIPSPPLVYAQMSSAKCKSTHRNSTQLRGQVLSSAQLHSIQLTSTQINITAQSQCPLIHPLSRYPRAGDHPGRCDSSRAEASSRGGNPQDPRPPRTTRYPRWSCGDFLTCDLT